MKADFRGVRQPGGTGTGQSGKPLPEEADSNSKKIIKYVGFTILSYILACILAFLIMAFTVIFVVLYGFGGPAAACDFLIYISAFAVIAFAVIFTLWYTFRKRHKSE
jgi:hypothetical protein